MNATLRFIWNKYYDRPVGESCPDSPHAGLETPTEIPNVGRDDLAQWFKDLGFTTGAEVGVEQGAYSEVLLRANPRGRLLLVDPWTAYPGYREHVSQEKLDGFLRATRTRLAAYPGAVFSRERSVDAARDVPDGSLDYVYIDANHELSHVIADLTAWTPKVRAGGIVAGHDYCHRKGVDMHVPEAVRAYTDAWGIRPWFVLGTKAKVDGHTRDRARSFLWVKS